MISCYDISFQTNTQKGWSSSMFDSIQHFNEFGVKIIEERVENFISEGKDIADLVLGLEKDLFELGRNILTEVLEDIDESLRKSGSRKKNWEIVRKDKTTILTSFGDITYNRTYFKPKKRGKRQYLVDKIVGIDPHDRISADVLINTLDEAVDSSYKKAGKRASYTTEISKQTVMNKVHNIEVPDAPLKYNTKKDCKVLYIEADEDHVALQSKNTDKKKGIIMPKLVYVHEGIDSEKSTNKRKVLKNIRYFGGVFATEDIWLQVAKYIDDQYNEEKIETIYISGDGASWIRQGLNWINKSKFVLDNYHLNKYIKKATAHLNDESMHQALRDAIDWP